MPLGDKDLKKHTVPIIGASAFGYYCALSAKSWTWVFVSSDSGDWLACSNWWMVPQPYGSPLYISLARLIGLITSGNATVITMTILLSCLPSAVTVMLVYLIVHKLTNETWPAITSALVLLGAGIFLTQSTILEEYALAICFCTLAYWLYINNRRMLTALALGLGTAVHIFILPIAVFWFALQWREWKPWLKPAGIFVLTGILPYSLILILMGMDTPRLLAGGLNRQSLNEYVFGIGGTIVGNLSLFEAPYRLLAITKILLPSLGLAFVPLWYGLKRPYDTKKLVLLMIVTVSLWYHLTSLDPVSWTFIDFGLPAIAILCGIGLNKLTLKHAYAAAVGALILMCVNGAFLNANTLTKERPLATTYYDELYALPDGSVVVTNAGAYSLGLFYVMSEGKDLTPIVYPYSDTWNFPDYSDWLKDKYGIVGHDTPGLVQDALNKGYDVYFAGAKWRYSKVAQAFQIADGDDLVREIKGLTGLWPEDARPVESPKSYIRWNEILDGLKQ